MKVNREKLTQTIPMLSIDGKILEIYNMVEHFQPVYSLHCTQIAAFTHTHKNEHTHSRRLETDN